MISGSTCHWGESHLLCSPRYIHYGVFQFLFCSKCITGVWKGISMPGWSPEIANEFIRLAVSRCRPLDQLQIQSLVYIAHGWSLALHDQPLTGDRPEALDFGPTYKRLADALSRHGRTTITEPILRREAFGNDAIESDQTAWSDLEAIELEMVRETFHRFGSFCLKNS